METDQEVLDFLAANSEIKTGDVEHVTFSETISRPVKIQFLQRYLRTSGYIPENVAKTYEGLLLFAEAGALNFSLKRAIEENCRYAKFNHKVQKLIDLAFELNFDIHDIVKECMVYETLSYALSKGFVPKHFNYLDSYVSHTSFIKKDMIELRFSITPKDTLYTTSIPPLIRFYHKGGDIKILFECVEARLKAGYFTSDYGKPFGTDLIKLNDEAIFQLLVDYQYPFTDEDIALASKLNLNNRKRLIYGGILPGGDDEFSWEDFTTYASLKIKQVFASFLTSTVAQRQNSVLGLLAPELEQLIVQQYLGFNV